MTEEEFYSSTPKKLFKLAEIHRKINNPDSSNDSVAGSTKKVVEKYIDQISF